MIAASSLAAIIVSPSAAVASPVSTSDFVLSYSTTAENLNGSGASMQTVINALTGFVGAVTRSGVSLPDTANQSSCSEALPAGLSPVCFTDGDDNSPEWVPQGVTTSYDSSGTALSASGSRIVVSWYDNCSSTDDADSTQGCTDTNKVSTDMYRSKGTRISLLDPLTLDYRNVILVEPFYNSYGNASYKAVPVHAGGIAWYGNLLYVADTDNGFRVFNMNQFFDMSKQQQSGYPTDYGDKTQMGRQSGTFYSFGYRFMLPQIGRWSQATTWNGSTCLGYGPLRFSNVGLDRSTSPARLSVAEYCPTGNTTSRVARWNLSGSGLTNGTPADAYAHGLERVQGVVTVGNTYYFNASNGGSYGTTHRFDYSSTAGTILSTSSRTTAIGCEDLSYDGSSNRLYSVAEYYGKRVLYGLTRF